MMSEEENRKRKLDESGNSLPTKKKIMDEVATSANSSDDPKALPQSNSNAHNKAEVLEPQDRDTDSALIESKSNILPITNATLTDLTESSASKPEESETSNSIGYNCHDVKPDELPHLTFHESSSTPSVEPQPLILPPGVPAPSSESNKESVLRTVGSTVESKNIDCGDIISETTELSSQFVGRIIGKGGEQIRDLQARSACKVDVDQNVPHGAPKIITYQGTRDKIDFAKSLVSMLCSHTGKDMELPLGHAKKIQLGIPSTVVGKVIGRGGEMIKELQSKSFAKIQVDHSGAPDAPSRIVTVIGNDLSVKRAQEMINLLVANPMADASTAIDMLIREKAQGNADWGSGPPYKTMPNNGQGMTSDMLGGTFRSGNYAHHQSSGFVNHNQQAAPQNNYSGGMESEIFYASRMYMGRIIGSKGITINDLQKRSGCDIQINQNVPAGQDCEVNIKGSRQGIENVKQMLQEIMQMGPNHAYAGGSGDSSRQRGIYVQQTSGCSQQQYGQQQFGQEQQFFGFGQVQQQQPQQQHYAGYVQVPQQHYGQGYGSFAGPYGPQQPQNMQFGQFQNQSVHYAAGGVNPLSEWRSAKAPDGQIYYYNEKTGATTWDKPHGML